MPPTPQKKGTNWGRWSKTLSFWILVILIPVAFIQFSSVRSVNVTRCILDSVKTWRFPRPNGGQVVVNYPFIFKSIGF